MSRIDTRSAQRVLLVAAVALATSGTALAAKTELGFAASAGCSVRGSPITGTSGNDTFSGSAAIDIFLGRAGNDLLRGLGGSDCLYGEAGSDRLRGGSGADRLFGGAGADRLEGEAGSDRLTDTSGRDFFSGGTGDDLVDARDASLGGRRVADTISCGAGGRDVATVDRRDSVARDCERVLRR